MSSPLLSIYSHIIWRGNGERSALCRKVCALVLGRSHSTPLSELAGLAPEGASLAAIVSSDPCFVADADGIRANSSAILQFGRSSTYALIDEAYPVSDGVSYLKNALAKFAVSEAEALGSDAPPSSLFVLSVGSAGELGPQLW